MSSSQEPLAEKPVRWYLEKRFVIVMLVIFGPLALPLVWLSPKFSTTWKIGTTVLSVILTILFAQVTAALFQFLNERLKDIQEASLS